MKQKTRLWVLLLAVTLIGSSLTACSDDSSSGNVESSQSNTSIETQESSDVQESSEVDESSTESVDNEVAENTDVIGRVVSEGESSFDLNVFTTGTEEKIEDYTLFDFSTLTDTGETTTVEIDEDALFYSIDAGELIPATRDTLVVNDLMIAVTESLEGIQEIIVLESEKEDAVESADDVVAEITGIAEDGTLELTIYELSEDAVTAEYSIEDYASVDFSNYVATEVLQEFVVESTVVINVASEGALTEADSSAFTVGDMLLFYLGEEGVETITIYHNEE